MSSVMKAMQAAHKAQKLEERAAEEKRARAPRQKNPLLVAVSVRRESF